MEDHGAGFVPSQARTCERKVDAPQRSPSAPRTLATALIFHMISLPPVLRLALALQAGCITAPFSAGKIFTETCFITAPLRPPDGPQKPHVELSALQEKHVGGLGRHRSGKQLRTTAVPLTTLHVEGALNATTQPDLFCS